MICNSCSHVKRIFLRSVVCEVYYPLVIHLLQTLSAIGNEKNTTIIFPVPVDALSAFFGGGGDNKGDDKPKKRSKSPSPSPEKEETTSQQTAARESLLRGAIQ